MDQSSDSAIREFLCLIEGDSNVFEVEIAANKKISYLKKIIHQEGVERPTRILAKSLTLLKVTATKESRVNPHVFVGRYRSQWTY